ncbi:MAG TPA: UDP-N-acetylglucosamine 2-epimerase [Pseudacidobacterium sp.]|nr:UDP-N-acetylglucosamine 2-epimerase [Pseudacidobacterium sp.]
MRSIGVVTTSRADYSDYRPLLKAFQADPEISLKLYVSGTHLSPEFGLTVRIIENDGIEIAERIEMLLSSDTPEAITKSMALGLIGFGQAFSRNKPDILLVLGDRYEMLAAVLAALPFKIPVAHLSGGELTHGAIDDALRHCITKLSHLHFTSNEVHARRVIQLGEDPDQVFVSGEPVLDNVLSAPQLTPKELHSRFGVDVDCPFLLVTFHPVTLEYEQTEWQIDELLAALDQARIRVIFTMPNADTAGRIIATRVRQWIESHPGIGVAVDNFGPEAYHGVLCHAVAVVGNSSSGIIEAPSFKVPTVNIGTRQEGRVRAANVIDVGYHRTDILAAIQRAASKKFRDSLQLLENPYASKTNSAVSTITNVLKQVELGNSLLQKKFHDARLI